MADLIDQANDHAEFLLARAMERRPQVSVSEGAEYCEDCGDDIPPARRVASPGCVTCIECQTVREARGGW